MGNQCASHSGQLRHTFAQNSVTQAPGTRRQQRRAEIADRSRRVGLAATAEQSRAEKQSGRRREGNSRASASQRTLDSSLRSHALRLSTARTRLDCAAGTAEASDPRAGQVAVRSRKQRALTQTNLLWVLNAVAAVDSPSIVLHAPRTVAARPLTAAAETQRGSLTKLTQQTQLRQATQLNSANKTVEAPNSELVEMAVEVAPLAIALPAAALSPSTVSATSTTVTRGCSIDSASLTCRDEECRHICALIRSGSQMALLSSPPSQELNAGCAAIATASDASLQPVASSGYQADLASTEHLTKRAHQPESASRPASSRAASRRSQACVVDATDLPAGPVWTVPDAEDAKVEVKTHPKPFSHALLIAEPTQLPSSSGLAMVRRMMLPKLPALASNKIAPLAENQGLPPLPLTRANSTSKESNKVASSSPLLAPQPRRASFITLPSLPSSTHFLPIQVASSPVQSLRPSPEPSPPPKLRNGSSTTVAESLQDSTNRRRAPLIVLHSICTPSPPPIDESSQLLPTGCVVALQSISLGVVSSEPVPLPIDSKAIEPTHLDGAEEQAVTLIRRPKGAKWASRVQKVKQGRLENEVAALVSAQAAGPAGEETAATAPKADQPIAVIKPIVKTYQLPLAPRIVASTAPVPLDAMSPIPQRASPRAFPPTAAAIALARTAAPPRILSVNTDLPPAVLESQLLASRKTALLPSRATTQSLGGGASFCGHSSGIPVSRSLRTLVTYRAELDWDDNHGGRSLAEYWRHAQDANRGLAPSKTVFELMQSGVFGATSPVQGGGLTKQSALQPLLHVRVVERPSPFDNLRHVKPPPLLILDQCFPKPSLEDLLKQAHVQCVHTSLRQAQDKRGAVAVRQVRLTLPLTAPAAATVDAVSSVPQPRPLIPLLNLKPLLGTEPGSAMDRSSTRSCRSPQRLSEHERLFPITPETQRQGCVQLHPEFQLPAAPSRPLNRQLRLFQMPVQDTETALQLATELNGSSTLAAMVPARATPSPPRPSTPAVAVESVKLDFTKASAAVVSSSKAIAEDACFSHDLSDLVALKPFIASLMTASSQGSGGIQQLTLFQSVPHKPMAIVEQAVWQILDAIILGAGLVPAEQASGRVLTKLDLSDVTSEGIVRSTMKRMSAEAAKDPTPAQKGVGGGAGPGSAAPGRGVLKLQSLCLRLNFLAMNQPAFAAATPIHALTMRALAAPGLAHLNLFQSNFGGKQGLETLVKSVLRSGSIKQLSLVSCSLGRWGGQIAHHMQSHPTLTDLNLSLNGLRDAEIAQCCALLTSPSSLVEKLNLSLSNFGLAGLTAIADAMSGPTFNGRLSVLSLEGNHFASADNACAVQVARLIRCRGLLELNIGYSGLNLADCRLICTALSDPACTLKFFGIACLLAPSRQDAEKLTGLKSWQSGVEEVLRSLSLNSTLTRIDLRDSKLMVTANAVKQDASTPRILQSLQSLALLNPTLEVLHLSDNGLTSEQNALIQTQLRFKRDRQREVTLVQTARKLSGEVAKIELRAPSPRIAPTCGARLAAKITDSQQQPAVPAVARTRPPTAKMHPVSSGSLPIARPLPRSVTRTSLVSSLPARAAARATPKGTAGVASGSTSIQTPAVQPSSTSPPTLLPAQTRGMASFHAAHNGGKSNGPVITRYSRPTTAVKIRSTEPRATPDPSKQPPPATHAKQSVAAISSSLQRAHVTKESNSAGGKYLRASPFAPLVPTFNEQLWTTSSRES